jgi:hypothetical protein
VKRLCSTLFCISALTAASQAAITFTGDATTGTPTPTLSIEGEIRIEIIASGNAALLVFDEWVVSDMIYDRIQSDPILYLEYELNGGGVESAEVYALIDNMAYDYGSMTGNDGALMLAEFNVTAGDVLVIRAGQSFTFAMADPHFTYSFNSEIPASFSGGFYLTTKEGTLLSNVVTIPEPSSAMLGALGALALLRRRR